MIQPIISGGPGVLNDTATQYNRPFWRAGRTTTAARNFLVPVETTFRKLHVKLDTAPGTGNSYTFTLCDGAAGTTNTALAVTISDTATEGSNLVDEVVIAAMDATQLKCTRTGTPTLPNVSWSVEAEPTAAQTFITSGNTSGTVVNSAVRYVTPFGGGTSYAAEEDARILIPLDGIIVGYGVRLNSSPGAGTSYDFDIFKNGSIVSSTTATIADTNTNIYLSGLSIDIAPGDFVSVRCTPVGTPTARIVTVGLVIEPDTDGESIFAQGHIASLTSTTRYENFYGTTSTAAGTTDVNPYIVGETDFTLKDFYAFMKTAPGASKSRTFRLRKNSADGNNVITVSGTNTTGNDLTNEDNYTKGDTLNMMRTSAGSPTNSTDVHVAIVCFTGGVPPTPIASISNVISIRNIISLTL